jgi:type VI secretion system secreted protein Hcp
MAETIALKLKANGADIKGESTQTSLERKDSIECVYFENACRAPRESSSGLATGRRIYEPLILRKRIDKASPLMAKALVRNEKIDGKFLFFRPHPTGDGTTEQFFTVEIENGRMAGMKIYIPEAHGESHEAEHPLEEWALVFEKITWTVTDGGASYTDSWSQPT